MSADITEKLIQERRARLAAERLLAQKQRELGEANARLVQQAQVMAAQLRAQQIRLGEIKDQADTLQLQRRQALSRLDQATADADIARRRLWQAMETIRDGFALFDSGLRLVMANKAYLSAFRDVPEMVAGIPYDEMVNLLAQRGRVVLSGQDMHDFGHDMVARLQSRMIAPRVIELTGGVFIKLIDRWSEGGDLVCLALDITDTIHREAELDEARRNAEAASRAKSAFLANMSHELRTPMNGVVGMAELLCDSPLTDQQRLFAETIRSSGEALLSIINDVLDFSKIEAMKLALMPEPFDLERCLHEILMLLQPSAQEKGLRLLVDFDLFLPTRFIGDPGRIRQILTNLLGNAVKFTLRGHVLVRVVGIEIAGGDYDLHITVEDTGIGIASEHIDTIFGEFIQIESETNRRFEGTGLGLAITRQLIAMMGGTIWVDSAPGEGSCFGFRLRIPPADPRTEDRYIRPIRLKTAMVVDGQMLDRMILERQLQTYGLQVTTMRTAEEAVARLTDDGLPDVIFCDGTLRTGLPTTMKADALPPLVRLRPADPAAEPAQDDGLALQKPVFRQDLFALLQDLSYPDAPMPRPALPSGVVAGVVAAPSALRQMRVLAAEDNRTNQLVFRKMVEGFDIALAFAENGQEAITLWRQMRPDLIFMDISMPIMDGSDATRAIRKAEAEEGWPPVPIVALTAHAMTGDDQTVLAAGMTHYLTKPLKKAEIAERLLAAKPDEARSLTPDPAGAADPRPPDGLDRASGA